MEKTSSELIVVADRGELKVYLLDTQASVRTLRLVQDIKVTEAHGRFADEFTDQAGAFPNGGTNGQGNSIAERPRLQAEAETRCRRQIAEHITEALRAAQPPRWSFAAPSELNGAVLKDVPADLRTTLVRNIKKDLVNAKPGDVLKQLENTLPVTAAA
jgi:hypothetical protein